MKKLEDLVGQTVTLTFRGKSVNQYRTYQVISIASGFLELRGCEQDPRRKSEGTWYQNVSEIDTISDVKLTVEQPATVVPVAIPVKKEIPAKQVPGKSGPSQNKLL